MTLPLDLMAPTVTARSSLVLATWVPPHGQPNPPTHTTRTQPLPHMVLSAGMALGGHTLPSCWASTDWTFVSMDWATSWSMLTCN